MAWLRWEEQYSPQMPASEKDAAVTAFITKVVTGNPLSARTNLKAFLIDVANIVEVERNEVDPSGIFLDPRERFNIRKRIHAALVTAGVIRNFRLSRTEFENAFIEMWHDE